jgi:lipid-binding SYLF domain-containing protein
MSFSKLKGMEMGKMYGLSAHDWVELINQPSPEIFAEAFAEDATVEASVLNEVVVGAAEIRGFFDATNKRYESIAFVHEANTSSHTYLAWEGLFAGIPVAGVTVLYRDASGAINHIWLHHRPLAKCSPSLSRHCAARRRRGESICSRLLPRASPSTSAI